MTTATPKPKPMAPKKPIDDLQELQDAVFESMLKITPMEMHGESVVEKPKYILKPHLTERPLKQHEGLLALRKQLEDSAPKRSGQSRTYKEKK